MRPLTDEEMKVFFEKLSKYIGENIKLLLDRPDSMYCFRLHNERVFYVSEKILKWSGNLPRENIMCVGTCFGKFTKGHQFRLQVTALEYLAPYAKFDCLEIRDVAVTSTNAMLIHAIWPQEWYKIWLKPNAEQQFLYGNHVIKSGLGRITEGTEKYQGVIVYNMADLPLGFGVAAKSTQDCRHADPMTVVCFHQADIGEYIRSEDTLV